MERLISVLGLFLLVFVAWLLSEHKKKINYKLVFWGIALQMIFALIILKTPVGRAFFSWVNGVIVKLLGFTDKGADFVFGPFHTGQQILGSTDVASFAFKILPTIIFFSAFMTVLYYLGVMQRIVVMVAKVMAKTMKTSGAESLSAAANIFVGQTEAPLVIKPFVSEMTLSELMAVMTGGMATVAGGVMAAYVGLLRPYFPSIAGHLLAASIMSAPAALVIAKIIIPETEEPKTAGKVEVTLEKVDANVIDAAARGASEGLGLALNVGAMLLAFIALIYMFNAVLLFAADTVNIYAFGRDPYHPVMDVKSFGGKTISAGDIISVPANKEKGLENTVSGTVALAMTSFTATFAENLPTLEEGLTFRIMTAQGQELGQGSDLTVTGLNTGAFTIALYGDVVIPEGSSLLFAASDNPVLGEKDVRLAVKSSESKGVLEMAEGLYMPSSTDIAYEVRDSSGAVKFSGGDMKCTGGVKVNMEVLLGWLFAPFAFVMGVPLKDCNIIGMLLGEKIVLNEFFAYSHLGRLLSDSAVHLSQRSIVIATYALCGFANFQSIAIQIGGIGGIAPNRRHDLARLGLKSMIAGSIAAFMTATIAGILV